MNRIRSEIDALAINLTSVVVSVFLVTFADALGTGIPADVEGVGPSAGVGAVAVAVVRTVVAGGPALVVVGADVLVVGPDVVEDEPVFGGPFSLSAMAIDGALLLPLIALD